MSIKSGTKQGSQCCRTEGYMHAAKPNKSPDNKCTRKPCACAEPCSVTLNHFVYNFANRYDNTTPSAYAALIWALAHHLYITPAHAVKLVSNVQRIRKTPYTKRLRYTATTFRNNLRAITTLYNTTNANVR